MYIQIDTQRTLQPSPYVRFAEWWPAALLGFVALLSSLPDANAQSLLGL